MKKDLVLTGLILLFGCADNKSETSIVATDWFDASISISAADADADADVDFMIIGYFPTWGSYDANLARLDFSKVTHINIAFGNPNGSGIIEENLSNSQISSLVTQAHAAGVKVLISLGGAIAPTYETWLNNANRANFVVGLMNYVSTHQLDGVDVDLEGGNIPSGYGAFIQDLSDQLHPQDKLVTAALGTWYSEEIPSSALGLFDWINLMSYDVTGSWAPNNPGPHSPYSKAVADLAHWKGRGVAANRLTVGVPFYGYDFDNNAAYIAYSAIAAAHPGAENQDQVNNIYYNGIPTIKEKTTLAKNEAGGIMIWELTMDVDIADSRSLLQALNEQALLP